MLSQLGKWLFPRKISARHSLRAVLGLSLLAATATATAQQSRDPYEDEDYGYYDFEITPFVGYMAGGEFQDPVSGSDLDLEEANDMGVIFNVAVDEWRHYEFLYAIQQSEVGGTAPMDLDVEYLQIGGTVAYPDTSRLIPYFGLTVGAARLTPDLAGLDAETKFAFSIGGGFKLPLTDHLGLRFDARALVTLLDTDGNIFCVSDSGGGACAIRTKSDTFVQYSAGLGLTFAF